jgi:NAD(P)-dependent dehydrogenase (short-subunit alcohol dehydrogenase family)
MPRVLITGTSSGIGKDTAVELASRGWDVVATMRDLARRTELEQSLARGTPATKVTLARLDVTDKASMSSMIEQHVGGPNAPLDAIVHNAGVSVGAAFEDLPEADARHVMETNFFGVINLTRSLLPTFRSQRRGQIVIVTSDAAFTGEPANAIYCASKWALEGWAEAMAYELAPFGISIALIEPGPYRTSIWENSPRLTPPDSAYRPWLEHLFKAVDIHVDKTARDPKEVAVTIAKALEARRPRFRYPVGSISRTTHFLRGKMPSTVYRSIVSRYLGLHRVKF